MTEGDRRKELLKKWIDEGLHLFSEGVRLFPELHQTVNAEEKATWISQLGELQADLLSLQRELDKKSPLAEKSSLAELRALSGQPEKPEDKEKGESNE